MTNAASGQNATPHPGKNGNYPEQHKHHWLEYAAVIAAGSATLAAAFTACVGIWQGSIAIDTEKRQLRAYVGIVPGGVDNFGNPQKQTFNFTTKNYGHTPAYNFVADTSHEAAIHNGDSFVAVPYSPPIMPRTITLFPTMELPRQVIGTALTKQQLDLVGAGGEFQIVYLGIVYYDDAFGAKHFTRYCWMFKGANNMTAKDATACLSHNDSD